MGGGGSFASFTAECVVERKKKGFTRNCLGRAALLKVKCRNLKKTKVVDVTTSGEVGDEVDCGRRRRVVGGVREIVRDLLGCSVGTHKPCNTRAWGDYLGETREYSVVKYRMDWALRFEY